MPDKNEDVRVWVSSIGSSTIDLCDRRGPSQPVRPLKAGLKLADLDALRRVAGLLIDGAEPKS